MVFSVRSIFEKKNAPLSIQEAYGLWDLLVTNYSVIERVQTWVVVVHDPDLKILMNQYLQIINKESRILEKQMQRFSIKGVDSPRITSHMPYSTEIVTDELVSWAMLEVLVNRLEKLLKIIRSSTTNDRLRRIFISMALNALERFDLAIKYMKLKGWLDTPPLYPNIPPTVNETINVAEAFHLWDHLTFRYDNIQQTQLYYTLVHDGDFKLLLKTGLENTLQKQATLLEKEFKKFGLLPPKAPPKVIINMTNTEFVDDDYLFRVITTGMQGAMIMHAQSFEESTTNDRIRNLFKQLLTEEIILVDRLAKFGKLKGWFNPVPRYRS